MARTITLDGAQLREIQIVLSPTGQTAIQMSFALLSGAAVIQHVNLQEFTAQLQTSELTAMNALITAMNGVLSRVELS